MKQKNLFFKVFFSLFLFFVFFPYIQLIPIEGAGDTQPFALAISLLVFPFFLIVKKEKMIKPFWIFTLVFIISILIFIESGISKNSFRSFVNYLSLFVIPYSTYIFLKQNGGISNKFIKSVIIIWGTVGIIQTFVYHDFLSFLVHRFSGNLDSGRGVLSLAVEPSFYGSICVFLLFYSVFHLKSYLYSIFLLFQIIFLSKSSLALLLLGIILIVYIVVFRKILIGGICIAVIVVTGTILMTTEYFQDARMTLLLNQTLEGEMIFIEDGSANMRFSGIYFPLTGFVDHWGMPGGMDSYGEYVVTEMPKQSLIHIVGYTRIMSGYGGAIYELGILGLLIPIAFIGAIRSYFKKDKRFQILISVSFTALMFTAIPLALPYVAFFYGYLIYYSKHEIVTDKRIA